VVYNRALLDLARHYGFQPCACRPYRPKTKGKVERAHSDTFGAPEAGSTARASSGVHHNEVVHFLGPPGTGKSHLSLALKPPPSRARRSRSRARPLECPHQPTRRRYATKAPRPTIQEWRRRSRIRLIASPATWGKLQVPNWGDFAARFAIAAGFFVRYRHPAIQTRATSNAIYSKSQAGRTGMDDPHGDDITHSEQ
jgi:hypothetical protein